MNLSTSDDFKTLTEVASLGASVTDVSLTGNYPSSLRKASTEALQPSHGLVIISSEANSHQCVKALYRVIDANGAVLAKSFNPDAPFPKLRLFESFSQEVFALSATGAQALTLSDPGSSDVYKKGEHSNIALCFVT